MANLNNIVQVNVSTTTARVSQPGFGVPLILDYHTRNVDRVRFYSELSELLADGFTTADAAYKAAADVFAQSPRVPKLAIGRRNTAPDLTVDYTPVALPLRTYQLKVTAPNGTTGVASYVSDASPTVAEITAGLNAAIGALSLTNIVPTDATTYGRVKASAAGQWFAVEALDIALISCKQTQADSSPEADLALCAIASNAWYAFTMTTHGAADVAKAAIWAEANKKFYVQNSQDGDVPTSSTGDIGTTLKTGNYFRTALIFHPDGARFAGAAWLGATLASNPGAITFAFKQLAGISLTPLTEAQITFLKGKNVNFFTDYGGVGVTQEGKMASGEWMDIIRDRDAFEARIRTLVYSVKVNNPKVPFTDNGIALEEAAVRKAFAEFVASGFLVEGSDLWVVPTAASIASVDRAARTYNKFKVSARVQGAIHVTVVDVYLSA